MRHFLGALFGFLRGYSIFAFLAYWVTLLLSNSQFDRSGEASMTAALVVSPATAVAGLVAGVILGKRSACHHRTS